MHRIELVNCNLPAEAKFLLEILNKYGEARVIGGYVRDIIYKKLHSNFPQPNYYYNPFSTEKPTNPTTNRSNPGTSSAQNNLQNQAQIPTHYQSDIDLATNLEPNKVKEIISKAGINIIDSGIKYGTVTAIIEDNPTIPNQKKSYNTYEITTLRQDLECDGRYATVKFGTNWESDAARRDFTINALSLDSSGKVYDYFNGIEDLKNNQIKFIGDPAKRIAEDYLRILRYFRFVAYLNSEIEPEQLEVVISLQHNIKSLSRERIWGEVKKILSFDTSPKILAQMYQAGMFQWLYLQDNTISQDYTSKEIANLRFISNHPIANLSALLYVLGYDQADIKKLCEDWKLSNQDKKYITTVAEIRQEVGITKSNQREMLFRIGHTLYQSLLLRNYILGGDDTYHDIRTLYVNSKSHNDILPVNGNDIKKMGIEAKSIGIILNEAKDLWAKSGFSYNRTEMLNIIKRKLLKK